MHAGFPAHLERALSSRSPIFEHRTAEIGDRCSTAAGVTLGRRVDRCGRCGADCFELARLQDKPIHRPSSAPNACAAGNSFTPEPRSWAKTACPAWNSNAILTSDKPRLRPPTTRNAGLPSCRVNQGPRPRSLPTPAGRKPRSRINSTTSAVSRPDSPRYSPSAGHTSSSASNKRGAPISSVAPRASRDSPSTNVAHTTKASQSPHRCAFP